MLPSLAIGFGGFVGSLARYGVARVVFDLIGGSFPVGTLAVNALGSFFLGAILTWAEIRPLDPTLRAGIAVGFCGGFTTMSTFSFETMELMEKGAVGLAVVNVVGTILLCLASVWCGTLAARSW